MKFNINIQNIPHKDQPYNTVGNWDYKVDPYARELTFQINVSSQPDFEVMILVAIHELIEAVLCWNEFIGNDLVTEWDLAHQHLDDSGAAHVDSPYRAQHLLAEKIERELADYLGVDWKDYCEKLKDIK